MISRLRSVCLKINDDSRDLIGTTWFITRYWQLLKGAIINSFPVETNQTKLQHSANPVDLWGVWCTLIYVDS